MASQKKKMMKTQHRGSSAVAHQKQKGREAQHRSDSDEHDEGSAVGQHAQELEDARKTASAAITAFAAVAEHELKTAHRGRTQVA